MFIIYMFVCIEGKIKRDRIRNQRWLGNRLFQEYIEQKKLQWFGQVKRMSFRRPVSPILTTLKQPGDVSEEPVT